MRSTFLIAAGICLALEACSSRPREFTPNLGIAPPDQAKFDASLAECRQLDVAGKLDRSGRLASGGAGAAAGGVLVAGGTAAATSAGLYGAAAVMSATLVLMPVAIVGSAIGMAKIKRKHKEKAIQAAMTGCLHDRGCDASPAGNARRRCGERHIEPDRCRRCSLSSCARWCRWHGHVFIDDLPAAVLLALENVIEARADGRARTACGDCEGFDA